MKPLSATVDADALQAELAAAGAVLVCERPAVFDGLGDCGGPLIVEGFAAAASGIASVEVEIAGRGTFTAETGLARPDARLVLGDHPGARRPGFRVEIPTDGWPPAALDMRIVARGHGGEQAAGWARPRWFPPVERFADAGRAGRCTLQWVDPVLAAPVGELVVVSGCAASAQGIERVIVEAPGVGRMDAALGTLPATLTESYGMPPGWFRAYVLRLDLRDVAPGAYPISVTAVDGAGQEDRQHGTLAVDPAERYARWRAARPAPDRSRLPEPPLLAVFGGDGRAVERAAAGSTLQPSVVEHLSDPSAVEEVLRRVAGSGTRLVAVDAAHALEPDALAALGHALAPASGAADAVYGDEQVDRGDGRPVPRFKPGWSPELLLGSDYAGGVVGIGPAAAAAALEGWADPPASARDLLLRLVDGPLTVERVPHVLATRMPSATDPRSDAEARTVAAIAARRGRACRVEQTGLAGLERVRWPLVERPLVSIVIPTLGRDEPLGTCLTSLRANTGYERWEVVLVDSGDGRAAAVAERTLGDAEWRCVAYDRDEFNFSRAVNLGAEAAGDGLVLYLNDDTEFPDPDWLEALVEYATLPGVGAVGPLLLNPDETVQCAGVLVDGTGQTTDRTPMHAWRALPPGAPGPNGECVAAREVSVVGGACALVPRTVLDRVGGWDERFRMDYGDIDVCARIGATGLRLVCVPWSRVVHAETMTRPNLPDHRDRRAFHDRWGRAFAAGDPLHHPAYEPRYDGELRLEGVDA